MSRTGCDRGSPTPGRARGHDLSQTTPATSEQPTRGIVGAGDVYSTVDDLLRWDEALYGDRLLSPASRGVMFGVRARTAPGGAGYGWFARLAPGGEVSYFQHGGAGAGFTSAVIRRPRDRAYIAVLGNCESEGEFGVADGCRERLDAWLAGGR